MQTRAANRIRVSMTIASKIKREECQSFSLTEGDTVPVEIIDISALGICVLSQYYLPKGLIAEFEMDPKLFGLKKSMKLNGQIRYCHYIKPSLYRCGAKFIDAPESCIKKISQFVESSAK